jgi:hypothetical protein
LGGDTGARSSIQRDPFQYMLRLRSATRLTQGVPWLCGPASRRVCYFGEAGLADAVSQVSMRCDALARIRRTILSGYRQLVLDPSAKEIDVDYTRTRIPNEIEDRRWDCSARRRGGTPQRVTRVAAWGAIRRAHAHSRRTTRSVAHHIDVRCVAIAPAINVRLRHAPGATVDAAPLGRGRPAVHVGRPAGHGHGDL